MSIIDYHQELVASRPGYNVHLDLVACLACVMINEPSNPNQAAVGLKDVDQKESAEQDKNESFKSSTTTNGESLKGACALASHVWAELVIDSNQADPFRTLRLSGVTKQSFEREATIKIGGW